MRMAKRAKAYAAGTLDVDDEGDDVDEERDEPPKKPAARRGRPSKAAKANADGDTEVETKKKPARRTTKKTVESPTKVSKTKIMDGAAKKKKKKKKTLVYEDIGDSDDDSELTERFDFDTDEENAPDELEGEASDPDRQAAFFAAAEGSLEMQANDIDSSPLNSPVSTSPKGPTASPTKRRRKLSVGHDDDDSQPDLLVGMKGISTKAGPKASISSGQRPAGSTNLDVLEISDSD